MKKTYLYAAVVVAGVAIIAIGYFTRYKPQEDKGNAVLNLKTQEQSAELQTNENPSTSFDKTQDKSLGASKMHIITLKTNFGEIQFETYNADAPKTVNNFITLAQKGFYDNLTFHRVIKGFMIQGGDPLGNGMGGPGYKFEDELNPATESYKAGYKKGVVAMANAGPNTNGSQFFIMLENYPLPNNYTIFGKVIKGQEVVDAIGSVQIGANDKPVKPVIMESVTVEETGN